MPDSLPRRDSRSRLQQPNAPTIKHAHSAAAMVNLTHAARQPLPFMMPAAPEPVKKQLCASASSVRVTFELAAETNYGDTLMVVGGVDPLGSWKPEAGLALSTDTDTYPVWRASTELSLPCEYKLVILRAERNGARK